MSKKLLSGAGFLIAAAMFVNGNIAQAGPFFSVDTATSELVRINSTTGAVTVVGALGRSITDIDLTRTADGRLWGIDSVFNSHVDLLEISTSTGNVLSTTQINLPGIQNAEGLGHSGNQLVIGHSTSTSASNVLSDFGTDGSISNSVVTAIDMDGLSSGSGTVPFYAMDAALFGSWFSLLYELDPNTPSNPQIAGFSTGTEPIGSDLVAEGADIFFIDGLATPELLSFNLSSPTVLNRLDLDRAGSYRGLAVADSVAVSEPGIYLTFAIGIALLGIRRRRNIR
jgi:hypothetical protein